MNIAIIGTGNIGSALARRWAEKGHRILLAVRDRNQFKGAALQELSGVEVMSQQEAVDKAEVILYAAPAHVANDIAQTLMFRPEQVIIDASNAVMKKPEPYNSAFTCFSSITPAQVVKCFNCIGYEHLRHPEKQGIRLDMFMAGDSVQAKQVTRQRSLDCGFEDCIDFGGGDKVALLESFALCWINLAIMQGQGRGIAFKLLR